MSVRWMNGYTDDHTRVHLHTCKKKSSDYINASFVKVPSAMRSFICAQVSSVFGWGEYSSDTSMSG